MCRHLRRHYRMLTWDSRAAYVPIYHCVKTVRIRSYYGPYSVQMRENMDQNNSEHGHFLRSLYQCFSVCGSKWKTLERIEINWMYWHEMDSTVTLVNSYYIPIPLLINRELRLDLEKIHHATLISNYSYFSWSS